MNMPFFRAVLFFLLVLVFSASYAIVPRMPEAHTGFSIHDVAHSKKAMVVTANPVATNVARTILIKGGSAVDAAIAAELVLNLVEPQASGIGGGGFMTIYDPKSRKVISIDGREVTPANFNINRWRDDSANWHEFEHLILSADGVGVPGELSMLYSAHKKFGRLPWAKLFEPAINMARMGYPVAHRLAVQLQKEDMLWHDPSASALYRPKGHVVSEGMVLRNPALAEVFEDLAKNGINNFYKGRWAKDIVAAVNNRAGDNIISMKDLSSYRAKEYASLCGRYRAWKICSTRLPSSGAPMILEWLGLLENSPFLKFPPHSVSAWHWFIETGRAAYIDRYAYAGDTNFDKDFTDVLLSKEYQISRLHQLSPDKASVDLKPGNISGVGKYKSTSYERPSTSQISVVDSYGQVVSLTSSIEDAFGSRLMVDGFLLNNQLLDFSRPDPKEEVSNLPAPGKRPRSAMSPTIVFDNQGLPCLVLGSSGGSAIPAYLVGYLVRSIDWHEDPDRNIAEAHIFSRGFETEAEEGLVSLNLVRHLRSLGHKIVLVPEPSGMSVIERVGGEWLGIPDPRRDGEAAGI